MGIHRQYEIVSNTIPRVLSKKLCITGKVIQITDYPLVDSYLSGYPMVLHMLMNTHAQKVRRILEVGTRMRGINFLHMLKERLSGCLVQGYDLECRDDMKSVAEESGISLVECRWGDMVEAAESVDFFYHHHLNPQTQAEEFRRGEVVDRILRRGGWYVAVKGWRDAHDGVRDAIPENFFKERRYTGGMFSVRSIPPERIRSSPEENGYDIMVMQKEE